MTDSNDRMSLDSHLDRKFIDDVDVSHGFMSVKGNPSARRLCLRVLFNHFHRREAEETLANLPDYPRTYDDICLLKEATKAAVSAKTYEEIDLEEWHDYSDLNKGAIAVRDEEEVMLDASKDEPNERPRWFVPPKKDE